MENTKCSLKLQDAVGKRRLFGSAETVLVAVSGGIDSVVLLHGLLNLPAGLRPGLAVAHFNHQLRGAQSGREARFVEKLCRQWGVSFHGGEAPPWKTRSNLEERARELRYDFLRKAAGLLGLKKILTAHQADDQAETFLIRWIQGAGLCGLSGIPMVRDEKEFLLIRPLLLVSRKEIIDHASRFKLRFCRDPMNRSPAYLRSRVRKLLVALKKENPSLPTTAALNALFLRADQNHLESLTEAFLMEVVERWNQRIRCPLSTYGRLPEALRYRVLQAMAREVVAPNPPRAGKAGRFGSNSGENPDSPPNPHRGNISPPGRRDVTGSGSNFALPAQMVLKLGELLASPNPRQHYDLPHGIGFTKDDLWFELFVKQKGA